MQWDSPIPFLVTLVYFVITTVLACTGGVKINKRPVSPLVGIVLGPTIMLFMGVAFLLIGLAFTAPVWVWLIFLKF